MSKLILDVGSVQINFLLYVKLFLHLIEVLQGVPGMVHKDPIPRI